jgi:diacylglycerol kinase (ATP)
MKNEATGLKRLIAATRFSLAGMKSTFTTEAAFRQECWMALIMVPLAFWLGDSAMEIALMIGVLLILMITELLNTAIELVVDRIGSEFNELSGRAKDAGSAAVLLSLLLVLIVWVSALIG